MKRLGLFVVFALINFGGLALGSWLMGQGPSSDWYQQLNKAPWTPPGWVFGIAWTTIMTCYSIFLADLWTKPVTQATWVLFLVSLLTNVIWNYLFFNRHWMLWAFIVLAVLAVVIWLFYFQSRQELRQKSLLLLPYMIWLLIALSLNGYAVIKN